MGPKIGGESADKLLENISVAASGRAASTSDFETFIVQLDVLNPSLVGIMA